MAEGIGHRPLLPLLPGCFCAPGFLWVVSGTSQVHSGFPACTFECRHFFLEDQRGLGSGLGRLSRPETALTLDSAMGTILRCIYTLNTQIYIFKVYIYIYTFKYICSVGRPSPPPSDSRTLRHPQGKPRSLSCPSPWQPLACIVPPGVCLLWALTIITQWGF